MSRWFIDHRQQFIADCLRVYGQITRANLMAQFDISLPQASADIGLFIRQNPDALIYDGRAKAYVVNAEAVPSAPPREAVGVGIEGASRTESGGSPPLRAAKSDSQEGH